MLVLATWSVILLAGAKNVALSADTNRVPNILLILADDLGYSDPGFMGGEIPTPHLDRLAAGGLRFTQCYNSARCCPSRASLMTGLYPHQAGIGSFALSRPDPVKGPAYLGHLNDRCVTLAEVLGSAGYQTYMVGKWHMEEPGPIARGFDEFYGFVHGYEQDQWSPDRYVRLPAGRQKELSYARNEFYATDVFTDYALEFLKQARVKQSADAGDRPWFLYLAHSAPHFPVQAPRASVERFVETYQRGWDVLRQERFARQRQSGLADDSWTLTDRAIVPVDREDIANGYPGEPNPAWQTLPEDRRHDLARRMAIFAAMVSHIDQGVGRIVDDLQANGELDNTLILFLSDNGACYEWGPFGFDGPSRRGITRLHTGDELATMGGPGTYHAYGSAWANLCNTPLRLYKHFTHEGGNCTPLIIHWPARIEHPDRWIREPVHVMDILPTLCEVARAEYPTELQGRAIQPAEGRSLLPLLGDGTLGERAIASEHNDARSLRRGRWKVVRSKKMPWEIEWELYDISVDRCETQDLADQHPELTRELADEWMAWAQRVKVYPFFEGAQKTAPNSSGDDAPQIARRAIHVTCDVVVPSKKSEGVLLAQGGNQQGYALHIQDRQLYFSVRVNQQVTAIRAPIDFGDATSVKLKVAARLSSNATMILEINGSVAARGRATGLIPVQPVDGLSVGLDDRSAVGTYRSPFRFDGKVENVEVDPQDVPLRQR